MRNRDGRRQIAEKLNVLKKTRLQDGFSDQSHIGRGQYPSLFLALSSPNFGDTFNSTTGSFNLVLVNRIRNEIGTYGVPRDTILPGTAIRRIIGALSFKVK